MNLRVTSAPTAEIERPSRPWRIAALCGTVLVLATLAVGLWQSGGRSRGETASITSLSASMGGASVSTVPTAFDGRSTRAPTYLIVGSYDEALSVRALMNAFGEGATDHTRVELVVLDPGISSADLLDGLPRPPETRLVDVRQSMQSAR